MAKEFYITKTFQLSDVKKAEGDEAEKFLGTIKGFVSTTHKDDQGDILTKGFVRDVTKTLKQYTSVFKNHDTIQDPIGKIISVTLKRMEDKSEDERLDEKDTSHFGAYATIGISKTAEKEWVLIQEGVYNKFSIGGYLADFTYDEDKDAFIVSSGKIMEASIVGIPANNHASLTDVLKTLRKGYKRTHKKVNKNMDEKDYETILQKALEASRQDTANELAKFKSDLVKAQEDKVAKELALAEKTNFETEIAKYKALAEEKEVANKALAEQIAKSSTGRKTQFSHSTNIVKGGDIEDEFFANDPVMALHKSFMDFGGIMKSEEPFRIKLIPSEIRGRFSKYIRTNHLEF